MKSSQNIARTAFLVLGTLILATVVLFSCMNQSTVGVPANASNTPREAATHGEKRDPCALPTSDPMFVQTSTAMIEAVLTVSCYGQNKQRVIRNVIIDDSDTGHTTFEPIYVSQGPHVVKLSGRGYSPPCRVVQIGDGNEYTTEFSLVGAQ
ncbi:MAG TPA: hypothetical protein VF432_04135 [Thermoanaerobaculia bacterium]